MYVLSLLSLFVSANAFAEDTRAQVPIGIAVGPNQNIEVSFPNMTNYQGCAFSGAFVIDPTLDKETKSAMLSLLMQAKATNTPVRVRLNGCTDRPTFSYVFMDVNWL